MRPIEPSPGNVMNERPQLVNVAYRLLGSIAEAEDAVQEAYARWYALREQDRAAIESPGAWLTTVASRICLDLLGSARARRDVYVGEWIPEPLPGRSDLTTATPGDTAGDPSEHVTLDESVAMAFLVVLESMTPAERVAFILHDVFGYPFADVGEIVGRTPAACRQLASSARHRLRDSRPSATSATSATGQAGIVKDFKRAWEAKDLDALIGLLDPDATATADGGGRAVAALQPVEGAEHIARYLIDIIDRAPAALTFHEHTVNGQPGLVARQDGVVVSVVAFQIADDHITNLWTVRNPDKLKLWRAG